MTDQNQIQQLYADFCRFLRGAGSNGFYTFFQQAIRSFPSTLSVYEKYVERHVDLAWVEAIEKTIVPLDNIIRKPNSFIKREEDIIPIAQAHGIGPESVRHLAQHTSLISSVKKGRVTPARILNITKDDSLETYENRFIYTLIRQVSYFLDKRMTVLMKDAKEADQFDYHVNGNCDIGADKLTYNFSMHLETPHEEVDEEELINADISGMTPLQRVERLRKIFYTFQGSSLFQSLTGTPDVRPPLVMTNVLRKNPNFIVAVSLWNFILSYNQTGFTTEDVEQYRIPTENDKNELYALILLEYSMIKKQTNTIETMQDLETPTEQKLIAPNIVRRSIDDLCDTFDLTVDEVRKVYEKELKKKEKKRNSEFTKAQAVFERALQTEEENDRIDEIERNKRLLAEMLATLKAAMKDEEMLEKERRAAEEAARLAAEEAARLAEEAARQAEEEIEISDRGFIYRFRYSFEARLIQGGDPLQTYYTELKNYLLSYPNVKCKMAWGYERFYLGRKPIVKINGRGKGLNLFLALSPDLFDNTKYHVEDLRVEGKTTDYPTEFRVRSDRSLKYAKELIDMRMTELGLTIGELLCADYHKPYQTREELLALDPPLIKRVESNETPDSLRKKDDADAESNLLVQPEEEAPAEPVTGEDVQPAVSEDVEEETVVDAFGHLIRYRYAFQARLIQGGDPLQTYYTELKNYLLSYPNVKCKMAWGYERFYLGRKPIVKINGRGKGLNLFLALSPDLFDNTKYHVEDLRVEGKTTDYPSKFRVRSDRALKYAKELLAMRLTELGLVQGDLPTEDYHLPYRSREDLMALDPPLIKLSSTATPAEPSTNPIAIPASATPDEEDDRKMTAPTPIDPIDSLEEEPTAEPAPAEESTRRFSWKKMFARLFGKRNSENKKK